MSVPRFGGWILALAIAGGSTLLAAEPGDPAAAVVERVLARHEGFRLNVVMRTSDGHRFREGLYDVAVIESGKAYFLQLIHRETRRGIRIPATLSGHTEARIATSDETDMESRNEPDGTVIVLRTPSFTVESVLGRS